MPANRPPLLRWPGGNFVSGYHFADGIGPVGSRPRRKDLAWHTEESNRFGTDEFMRYCELIGAEPYLCVNMGTGTMDEAHDWVEYCNGTGDTYWANQRRANGHEEPYGVRLWGLGNTVIEGLAEFVRYHSLHIYTGSEDYWTNVLAPIRPSAIDFPRLLLNTVLFAGGVTILSLTFDSLTAAALTGQRADPRSAGRPGAQDHPALSAAGGMGCW